MPRRTAPPSRLRHGHARGRKATPEYRIWKGMLQRCTNPKQPGFKGYGAKGVKVHPGWRGEGGFERFLAYVGPRPTRRHSIDRFPDQAGDYRPGNVRWATPEEQGRNRSTNRKLTIDGVTLTLADWAERFQIDYQVFKHRVRSGWPLHRLGEPVGAPRSDARFIEHAGQRLTLASWAKRTGLKRQTIARRLASGWSTADALQRRRARGES
jgi:hypothetical protein